MGLCVNFLGIPLLEDSDCADRRRKRSNERKAIEEASDVAKRESKDDRRETNTFNRNQQQLGSSIARNYGTSENAGGFVAQGFDFLEGAVAGGNQVASDVFGSGGAGSAIAGAYLTGGTSLLGGLFGGTAADGTPLPTSPLVPLAALAALAAVAYVATQKG